MKDIMHGLWMYFFNPKTWEHAGCFIVASAINEMVVPAAWKGLVSGVALVGFTYAIMLATFQLFLPDAQVLRFEQWVIRKTKDSIAAVILIALANEKLLQYFSASTDFINAISAVVAAMVLYGIIAGKKIQWQIFEEESAK